MSPKTYLLRSRDLSTSFLFIIPLLALYELGMLLTMSQVKNAADVAVKTPFFVIFGAEGALVFNLAVIVGLFVAMAYQDKDHGSDFRIFLPMLGESLLYAVFFGRIIVFLLHKLFPFALAMPMDGGLLRSLLLSIGAGVYEEILFRFMLLGGLYAILIKLTGLVKFIPFHESVSAFVSILVASYLFSWMHYVGPMGDQMLPESFWFRFLAGVVLSAIYVFRGLGIAAYTHAIYDVLLLIRPYEWL